MTYFDVDILSPDLLKEEFPKYTAPIQCSKDLSCALKEFTDLKVWKREVVVEGNLCNMINIEGTIGVVYKGKRYHTPVRVILQTDYPNSPLLAYITPTKEIRIGHNIPYLNDCGKIVITYLTEWHKQKSPDLPKLLYQLRALFAEQPPVATKVRDIVQDMKARADRHNKNQSQPNTTADDGSLPNQQVSSEEKSLPDEVPSSLGDAKDGSIPPQEENISNVLTTYTRGELIGSGGFAKVYLYEHKQTNHRVACKIVDLGVNDSEVQKCANALKREIQLLKHLKHDFIINFKAMEEHNNTLAIVMDYFPRGSIYFVMMKLPDQHLDESATRVFTWQILQGLKYLHENKIVHKDIKARNILLDHQDIIRIADFGISKKIRDLETATTGKEIFASLHWQSPEFLNSNNCGFKTDVWSLGCTIVEMLFGQPPLLHECKDIQLAAALNRISKGDIHPPSDCSVVAKEFLSLCFRPEEERPTAEKLMADTQFPLYSV